MFNCWLIDLVVLIIYCKWSDDVGQKWERLNLRPHKVHKHLLVKVRTLHLRHWRLQVNCPHDKRHKFSHFLVHVLLVDLVDEHDNDRQFLEYFQREYSLRQEIVLEGGRDRGLFHKVTIVLVIRNDNYRGHCSVCRLLVHLNSSYCICLSKQLLQI